MSALTDEQRVLLIKLVRYAQEQRLNERIVPIPAGPAGYVIHVLGLPSLHLTGLNDLDALCQAGVLGYHINRFGTGKLYCLTSSSYKQVAMWLNRAPQEEQPSWRWAGSGAEGEPERIPSTAELIAQFDQTQRRLHHELVKLLPQEALPDVLDALTAVSEALHKRPPKAIKIQANLQVIAMRVTEMLAAPHYLPQVGRVFTRLGDLTRLSAEIIQRRAS